MLILQVVSRFVFNFPIIWTNEIATLAFMWMIFVGAIGAVYENDMIRMNMIVDVLGEKTRKTIEILFQVVLLVISLVSIPYSFILVEKMHILKFDITEIPYSIFYFAGLCFFVACVPCCIRMILRIVRSGSVDDGNSRS